MIHVADDIQLRPLSVEDVSDIFRMPDEEREYMCELLVDNKYTDIRVFSLLKRDYKGK